jgi:small conductance mechanosensitive channel
MERILKFLVGLAPSFVLLLVGTAVIKLLLRIINKALERTKLEKTAHPLIKTIARIGLYVLLLLMVASNLGVDVTGLVAVTSVASLVLSLSLQEALTNLIGGFTLLSTRPFVAGDFVEVAGQAGTVQAIGLTYTKLSTGDNKIISIPNSAVVSAQIVNYSVSGTRRVEIMVSASYAAPTETVKAALRKAAEHPAVLADPAPFAGLQTYGDHAINYVLRMWCLSADYWTVYYQVNERIRQEFQTAGVEMTYPHLNVHVDK